MSNNTVQFEDRTPEQQAAAVLRDLKADVNAQERVSKLATVAFAGRTYQAPKDSALGYLAVSLQAEADKFREAKKAGKVEGKFQLANMLVTRLSRWLKDQERFAGRRVSINTTKGTIALVVRKDNNHKDKPKANKDATIKGVKDLASLIAYAIDNYGAESVAAEVVKQTQKAAA